MIRTQLKFDQIFASFVNFIFYTIYCLAWQRNINEQNIDYDIKEELGVSKHRPGYAYG